MDARKIRIIVVLGPTATGKSDLGIGLAKRFGGEVVSADSRQVYKGLDIGSGKITKREMKGVPHHLLDVASPRIRYTAARYAKDSICAVRSVVKKDKVPIIVGRTGLYIDTLVHGILFPEVKPDPFLRRKLERMKAPALFALLKKKDPRRAASIDPHNRHRLIRALEIVNTLGTVPLPAKTEPRFDTLFIGLALPFEELRTKIRVRLEKRLKQGMTREVKKLRKSGLSWKRLDELGLEYRFASRYVRGLISRDEMVDEIERESVGYAKRQMTWFKRNKDIAWVSPTDAKKIEKKVIAFLKP